MRHSGRVWLFAAIVLGSLAMAGCAKQAAEPSAAEPAADVQPVEGKDVSTVKLTAEAVKAVGIETIPVGSEGPGVRATSTVIPVTALIYDPSGKSWVYVQTAERTYVREPIVIDLMDGTTMHVHSGPKVGTPVVTVGASELLGAEYGVGAE